MGSYRVENETLLAAAGYQLPWICTLLTYLSVESGLNENTIIMNSCIHLLFVIPVILLTSCGMGETDRRKEVNPESIYFDYKIWGEEGYDSLTVRLQYRNGGRNGASLLVNEPGKVELDGESLRADSSKMTGVYYEVQKPVAGFRGKHTITFTVNNRKQYQEVFDFQPVSLSGPVPLRIKRGDLVFRFDGLSPEDNIRVLMTDTSYLSEEINRVDSVRNGRLVITEEELTGLSSGPVYLEITKEYERPVRNGTRKRGRLSVSYGLKREFILTD